MHWKISPMTWLRLGVFCFLLAVVLGPPIQPSSQCLAASHCSHRNMASCLEIVLVNPFVNRGLSDKAVVKVNEDDDDDDDDRNVGAGSRELVPHIVSSHDTLASVALSQPLRHHPLALHPLRC